MEKINILFLTQDYFVGGAEIMLYSLFKHIDRKRFNCIVCCYKNSGKVTQLFKKIKIKIKIKLLSRKKNIASQMNQIARIHKIDIVYVNTYKLLPEAAVLRSESRRIIYHMHHILAHTHREISSKKKELFLKAIFCVADRIITCSGVVKRQFDFLNPGTAVEVVYNGIDTKKFFLKDKKMNKLKLEYNIQPEIKTVAIIGRIEPQKKPMVFIKSCRKIMNSHKDVKFFIIGEFASRKFLKKVQREIKRLLIKDSVILTGFREDMPEVLQGLDVLVLTSVNEAFNLALLEGMAAGKAVIATNTGGTPEMIKNGRNGILVARDSVKEFSEAAVRLLKNDRERGRMGKAARREVLAKYTMLKHVKKIERIIKDIDN